MCIRSDYFRNFGGDSRQMLKSVEYLRKLGVEAHINAGDITDFSSYDIVHLFNLASMGETYKYYKIAKSYKKNIVLSPLYWDRTLYYKYINNIENLKLWERCSAYRKEIVKGWKLIFPNSYMEAELLRKQIYHRGNYVVIYNGVEVISDETPLYNLKDRYHLDSYVLCVGRICVMKNQLVLAKICNELNIPLVLIGNIKDKAYLDACLKFKGTLYYRFASLHVLPSFIEAPGMSSLEAAASGCKIVSTNQGSAYEYFQDGALYCNPYDEASIYETVKKGIKAKKDCKFKNVIREKFTWEKYTKDLYESYKTLM